MLRGFHEHEVLVVSVVKLQARRVFSAILECRLVN